MRTTRRTLESLRHADLVQRSETGRYIAGTSKLFSSYTQARVWLDTERGNLVHIAEQASEYGLATYTTDLAAALWQYLDIGCYYDDGRRLHTCALEVSRSRNDTSAEAGRRLPGE